MNSKTTYAICDELGEPMACGTDPAVLRAYAVDLVGIVPHLAVVELVWAEPGHIRNRLHPPKPKRPGRG